MKKIVLFFLMGLLVLTACKKSPVLQDEELMELITFMSGSFSSQEQSALDTNYYDIRLEMIPIWPENAEAEWLYVEQSVAWSLDKPYRQRVYRLIRLDNSSFESAVYTLDSPQRFAGAWRDDNPLSGLTPDSLVKREGCTILLKHQGDVFIGSTVEKQCQSSLRGASYATSEVRVEADVLTSWDRGFDADDTHVWGAERGPYVFKKIPRR